MQDYQSSFTAIMLAWQADLAFEYGDRVQIYTDLQILCHKMSQGHYTQLW